MKPFAIVLYERFVEGATIQQLASELGISADRIAVRIRAAEAYTRQHVAGSESSGPRDHRSSNMAV